MFSAIPTLASFISYHIQAIFVQIRSIKLVNWKNFESATLAFAERLVLFTGLNGMGKTNLLDAIHYLCMTRSYFGLREKLLVRHGADFFRLEAGFEKDSRTHRVVAKVVPGKKKEFEVDGTPVPTFADHIGQFPVVMVAPADIQLAYEGSESRRKLLDAALSQTDKAYLDQLVQYTRLLKHRNHLLRQLAEQPHQPHTLLDTIDHQMAAPAQAIHQRRAAWVERLNPLLQHYYEIVSEGRETVACTYKSQLAHKSLSELLTEKRRQDLALGYSTAGIHRDDLDFRIDGRPLKQFASQGQLKSFILALKLAQYQLFVDEHGRTPLLLLDDLFDKLDQRRVSKLLELLLSQNFGQVCITDTHAGRIPAILRSFGQPYDHYCVQSGQARPCPTESQPEEDE